MKNARRSRGIAARNLRSQLIVTTITPVVVLLLVFIIVGAIGLSYIAQTLIQDRDAEVAELSAVEVANQWADSVLLLSQIASEADIIEGDLLQAEGLLDSHLALHQRFDALAVTDSDGKVIVTYEGILGENIGSFDFFNRARTYRRPVRSEIYVNSLGERTISVAVPYFDTNGRFGGCVLGNWLLSGSTLYNSISHIQVGESGYAFLVDQYGIILAYPDSEFVAAQWTENPAVQDVMRGNSGAQIVIWRGFTTIMGYAPISSQELSNSLVSDESWDGWGLLTIQKWEDIIRPFRPYLLAMIISLGLAVIVPLLFLALNSRWIVQPLQSLVTQAERVASGDLSTDISIDAGPLEVRELEEAFSVMVGQIRKYRRDNQSYIVSILNSQEEERKRIARELHDDTAQALTVLARRIELLGDIEDRDELEHEIGYLRDYVDITLQNVRNFARDLRPPLLSELGLPRTLELLGARVEREDGIEVRVDVQGEFFPLLPQVELGLYRLAQESLSNVRRHANAQKASVTLTYRDDFVTLQIMDDGVGFDAPRDPSELVASGKLGLAGLYERTRLFGGKAIIDSKKNRGTVVSIAIPVTPIILPIKAENSQEDSN